MNGERVLECSFCRKAGSRAFVCDECVAAALVVIADADLELFDQIVADARRARS